MKKLILITSLLFISLAHNAFAVKGCCSNHGGVCGCECCDGSLFTMRCQKLYSECKKPQDTSEKISDVKSDEKKSWAK